MPEYIMLFRYTTKGVQTIKDAPNRIVEAKKLFEQNGAQAKAFYAVLVSMIQSALQKHQMMRRSLEFPCKYQHKEM